MVDISVFCQLISSDTGKKDAFPIGAYKIAFVASLMQFLHSVGL